MRIQSLFQKAHDGSLTWKEVAEMLGVDPRTVRRWKAEVEENGFEALLDERTRRPSPKRAPESVVDQVKELYKEKYWEWNVKHFSEQLPQYGIPYRYTWVKKVLQGADLVPKSYRYKKHRKRREPKPMVGMMLHIDGSEHAWIPLLAREKQCLILVMDDATNDPYYAKLVPEESTLECMRAFKQVVETQGLFCSIYSDRAGHFFDTPKAGSRVDLSHLTQIGQAFHELGIEMIPAYSPQARGRSERMFRTWQDRLPKELRLHGIKTLPDANRYILEAFLPWYRKNLIKPPREKGSAFIPYQGKDLDFIFSIKEQRRVNHDNTIQFQNQTLQIQPSKFRISFAQCNVTTHQHLDGRLSVCYGPHTIACFEASELQSQQIKNKNGRSETTENGALSSCVKS